MYTRYTLLAKSALVPLPEPSSPTRCIPRSRSKSSTGVPFTASSQSYTRCRAACAGSGDGM